MPKIILLIGTKKLSICPTLLTLREFCVSYKTKIGKRKNEITKKDFWWKMTYSESFKTIKFFITND